MYERLGLVEVGRFMRGHRLRWYGHVVRLSSAIWTRRMMKMELKGRGTRGRLKRTWREIVEMDVRDTGVLEAVAGTRGVCGVHSSITEANRPTRESRR